MTPATVTSPVDWHIYCSISTVIKNCDDIETMPVNSLAQVGNEILTKISIKTSCDKNCTKIKFAITLHYLCYMFFNDTVSDIDD